jgi:dipeptidase E
MERHIVAMGGRSDALETFVLELAHGPRVCFVPTAQGDDRDAIVMFYERLGSRCDATHLRLFGIPRRGVREHLLAQDAIYVAGGNTANMLAVWRTQGVDSVLREAWEAGVVLCGWSAGANCWFEASITDSFGSDLAGMEDGLGFLPGSFCPHYDSESSRRPVYTRFVADGFPPGYAADDGVAVHFVGTQLAEAVGSREGALAYRVSPDGERPLETKALP